MSNIDIYYFSGTGNTLHAVRELKKRLPQARLIPIAGLLDQETIRTTAPTVGFAFPLHMMTLPIPLRHFFRKLDLSRSKYVFALVTRIGTPAVELDKILRKQGRGFDALFFLNMPDNDPKLKCFKASGSDDWLKMEAALQKDLDAIAPRIIDQAAVSPKEDRAPIPTGFWIKPLVRLGVWFSERIDFQESFYADEKCTGCGTCELVCPAGKIEMDGEPRWREDKHSFNCFACVDFCPEAAVQIRGNWMKKSYTAVNGRYHHPDISPEDIAEQKKG